MSSSTLSDDCDIISQTPEKPKKKLKRNLSKRKQTHYAGNNIVIRGSFPHTARELHIHSNPFTSSYSSSLRTNTNKLMSYIFHTHEDILSYTQDDMPKHNNIRMVGIIKSNSSLYFLKKHHHTPFSNTNLYIIINTKNLDNLPNEDECVELFGFVEFDTFANKNLPVLNVRFWRKTDRSSLSEYISCLELQKSFVPSDYHEKVCALDDTTYLEVAGDITELFNEHDESKFKNLSIIENNMSGLEQIVNTSFSAM